MQKPTVDFQEDLLSLSSKTTLFKFTFFVLRHHHRASMQAMTRACARSPWHPSVIICPTVQSISRSQWGWTRGLGKSGALYTSLHIFKFVPSLFVELTQKCHSYMLLTSLKNRLSDIVSDPVCAHQRQIIERNWKTNFGASLSMPDGA
jgi:hypothetical protein